VVKKSAQQRIAPDCLLPGLSMKGVMKGSSLLLTHVVLKVKTFVIHYINLDRAHRFTCNIGITIVRTYAHYEPLTGMKLSTSKSRVSSR